MCYAKRKRAGGLTAGVGLIAVVEFTNVVGSACGSKIISSLSAVATSIQPFSFSISSKQPSRALSISFPT